MTATVDTVRSTGHRTSGTAAAAGIWLIIAPFGLGYAELPAALWNDVIVGAAVVTLALIRVGAPLRTQELSWINAALGAWLIAAPSVLGYASAGDAIAGGAAVTANGTVAAVAAGAAFWNDIIVGVIIGILATQSATAVAIDVSSGRVRAPLAPSPETARGARNEGGASRSRTTHGPSSG